MKKSYSVNTFRRILKSSNFKRLAGVTSCFYGQMSIYTLNIIFLCNIANAYTVTNLKWDTRTLGRIEQRNGLRILKVKVPENQKSGINCVEADIDLKPWANSMLEFSIRIRSIDASKPEKYYNGIKFMLNYSDVDGKEYWFNVKNLWGTFDWKDVRFSATVPGMATKAKLKLGLQDSAGEVEFDLDSLRIVPVFQSSGKTTKAVYSETVKNTLPLRGFMSPVRFKEDDFKTLKDWNANIVRAQLIRNWHVPNAERDIHDYRQWLDDMLNHYQEMFKLGYEKYNLRFVIDLHTPPGGRYKNREMAMFYEKKFADHFIEVWKSIATRFKDNPAVWAYGLINEPNQQHQAPFNYWALQKNAAEAIRRIDPVRPIIVASNWSNSPFTFCYLELFDMVDVIYEVHMYQPGQYTHQGVNVPGRKQTLEHLISYPGNIGGRFYGKEELCKDLHYVREFQKKHNARIYAGEFSAVIWAPGADRYLRDCIDIFEKYGWDWTYHAFRESPVWDLEKSGNSRNNIHLDRNNQRKKVVLDGLRKNKLIVN